MSLAALFAQPGQPDDGVFSDLSIRQSRAPIALSQVRTCAIVAVFRAVSYLGLTMSFILQPWQLLCIILAGWVNQQQQQVIDFQRTENRRAQGEAGEEADHAQRRPAAAFGGEGEDPGAEGLEQIGTLFTPDTILRWHRVLVAHKWDYSDRRKKAGRPRVRPEITELVLRFAENPSWGYDRIQGLANLGHQISDQTVGNILKEHGIEPAPERKRQTTWKTFIKSHWDVLGAIDFTTIEVWTKGGLVTFYLLFVMEVATRRVHFAGCTPSPTEQWMKQIARNLTDARTAFSRASVTC